MALDWPDWHEEADWLDCGALHATLAQVPSRVAKMTSWELQMQKGLCSSRRRVIPASPQMLWSEQLSALYWLDWHERPLSL